MGKFSRIIKYIIFALIAITVISHVLIISNLKREEPKRLIRNHEEALCNFRLNRTITQAYHNTQKCPNTGIVTAFYGGGLYSQMWSYSSVWALSKVTLLKPFIPICTYNFLLKAFDNLKVPPLTTIPDCDIFLPNAADSYETWAGINQSIVLPSFSALSELVLPRVTDLIEEFRLRENLLKKGEAILREFTQNKMKNPFYVGIHLPRKWETYADGFMYPNGEFFNGAFHKIRKLKNETVFVIIGEDQLNQFKGNDFLFADKIDFFGLDLALLSLCNMSILGYEDIGIWGAILSKGETIIFDKSRYMFEEYIRNIPNWKVFT